MTQSYIGEIRMFAGNFAPYGWAFCDGTLLDISGNETLFTLIGTTYGGDGIMTFALPDLRGRVPIHFGQNTNTGSTYQLGGMGGTETVAITSNQMPSHSHSIRAFSQYGKSNLPDGNLWAKSPLKQFASGSDVAVTGSFPTTVVGNAGSGMPHDNMMPILTMSFIIALYGIYPTPG